MKLIIAGSRNFKISPEAIEQFIQFFGLSGAVTEVVCGVAQGVDTAGYNWAVANRVPCKMFPADWKKHGKAAGPIRNKLMAEHGTALLLIWDGKSKGSANMKKQAQSQPVVAIYEVVLTTP